MINIDFDLALLPFKYMVRSKYQDTDHSIVYLRGMIGLNICVLYMCIVIEFYIGIRCATVM